MAPRSCAVALALAALAACGAAGSPGTDPDADPSAPDAPPASSPDAPPAVPDARVPIIDPCFPVDELGPGHHVFPCDGITYDVEIPATCPASGCGIILDVHGLTMSAAMLDANDGLRARGTAAGFVVVQPNANPAPPQASWTPGTDDDKLFDVLTRAIGVFAIDPARVHFTGFSQGGFMAWRMICDHADTFASVAPAAGASSCVGNVPACAFTGAELPSQELSILYLHGRMEQNYVPWTCAQPQVDAVVAAWGLASQGIVDSSATHTRERFTNASGTTLEFLAHDYYSDQFFLIPQSRLQGHCFPGSTDPGGQPGQLFSFKCEQPAAFVWGQEVVDFFVAHPKAN
jgi:polyhydroxybutyrate depolymerase